MRTGAHASGATVEQCIRARMTLVFDSSYHRSSASLECALFDSEPLIRLEMNEAYTVPEQAYPIRIDAVRWYAPVGRRGDRK